MNNKTLIIGTLFVLMLLTACSQRAKETQQPVSQQQTATDENIDAVDKELGDADKLAQDLETEDIENVDAELDDVEQADI
ncbi:hypothetical protein HY485_03545 [Candidatus Woesearchaeota archaeon]|nr:hypothetical protein [Candidatus Woesearchaeota archaeon]